MALLPTPHSDPGRGSGVYATLNPIGKEASSEGGSSPSSRSTSGQQHNKENEEEGEEEDEEDEGGAWSDEDEDEDEDKNKPSGSDKSDSASSPSSPSSTLSSSSSSVPSSGKAVTPLPKLVMFVCFWIQVTEALNVTTLFPYMAFLVEVSVASLQL